MQTHKTQPAALSAKYRTAINRDTGRLYYIVREYQYCYLVRPAWRKKSVDFTMPKTSFFDLSRSK